MLHSSHTTQQSQEALKMSDPITYAHLLQALRDDQIKITKAIVTLNRIVESILAVMALWAAYLFDAGGNSPLYLASLAATLAVLCWALCFLPSPESLLTDIGPISESEKIEPPPT